MKWIGRIYKHSNRYDIIINFADGKEYVLFNAENYRSLTEIVERNTGICLVRRKHLHFMRDGYMDLALINACNSKTDGCCVTVKQAKDGTFDWHKELEYMKAEYKQEQIDKQKPKEKTYLVYTITTEWDSLTIKKSNSGEVKAYSPMAAMSVVGCWVGTGTIIITHCLEDNTYHTFEKRATDNPIEGYAKVMERENITNITELLKMVGGV